MKINSEFDKFAEIPNLLKDGTTDSFVTELEIDLLKLCGKYYLDNFNDSKIEITSSLQVPMFNYLLSDSGVFKFSGAHPGSNSDSRRDNSRSLGQSVCRYLIYYFFDAPYTTHISTVINKKLSSDFNNIKIERSEKGDTPDFISARTPKDIFLSEAKGRRKKIDFKSTTFRKWRKQFDRISIKDGEELISLKGYISEFVIANETNKLDTSILLVEDPVTKGTPLIQNNYDLYNLIKCAHYAEVFERLGLGVIGGALILDGKLKDTKQSFPVFELLVKNSRKKYIGRVIPRNLDYRNHYIYDDFGLGNLNSGTFYGLEESCFKNLIQISRGNFSSINEIRTTKNFTFNESLIGYKDNTILADVGLIKFNDFKEY